MPHPGQSLCLTSFAINSLPSFLSKKCRSQARAIAALALNLPFVENFPAQRWDLNIIEDVRAILKAKVNVRRPRGTKGHLKVIREEWRGISQTTIDKIVAKVPDRLLEVVGKEGAWLKRPNSKGQ